MTRLSNWIPVFTGMTWKVDSGPDSNAGQAFHRNDGGNGNDKRAVAMTKEMTGEIAMRCVT